MFFQSIIRSLIFITKTTSARIFKCSASSPWGPCKYTKAHKQKENKIKPEKRTSCSYTNLVRVRHLFKPSNTWKTDFSPLYWSYEHSSPLQTLENLRNGLPTPKPILWSNWNHFHSFIIIMCKIIITESACILSLIWKNLISLCARVKKFPLWSADLHNSLTSTDTV